MIPFFGLPITLMIHREVSIPVARRPETDDDHPSSIILIIIHPRASRVESSWPSAQLNGATAPVQPSLMAGTPWRRSLGLASP